MSTHVQDRQTQMEFRHYPCEFGFVRLRSQEKQALKIVRFQRHLPLTIQFYISCRIIGAPSLQSDFYGLSSALKDDTNKPKKRKEARTKPTKMARKKSTLRTKTYLFIFFPKDSYLGVLRLFLWVLEVARSRRLGRAREILAFLGKKLENFIFGKKWSALFL